MVIIVRNKKFLRNIFLIGSTFYKTSKGLTFKIKSLNWLIINVLTIEPCLHSLSWLFYIPKRKSVLNSICIITFFLIRIFTQWTEFFRVALRKETLEISFKFWGNERAHRSRSSVLDSESPNTNVPSSRGNEIDTWV